MKLLKKIIDKLTYPFKTKKIVVVTDKADIYIIVPFIGEIKSKTVKRNGIRGYSAKNVYFDESY